MGYHTDFFGEATIHPPLCAAKVAYINALASLRRMKWHDSVEHRPDPIRIAAGIPSVGKQGMYFTGGNFTHDDPDLMEYNWPPADQP
eukprot:2469769-Amphidinium_carterae.1